MTPTRSNAPTSRQEARSAILEPNPRLTALQTAKDIAGKTREIQGLLYMDDAPARHEKLDAFLLSLLEPYYPEVVAFVRKLRFWYG